MTGGVPLAFARFGFPTFGLGSDVNKVLRHVAKRAVQWWFESAVRFVARIDMATIGGVWRAVDATTEPVMSGAAWKAEFGTMSLLAAVVMLPLLCVAALQAVARQDPSGLLRTAFIRVPLALLLTGAVVGLVSLGIQATDGACSALMSTAASPLHHLFLAINTYLGGPEPVALAVNFLAILTAGFFAFVVWLELAVRSAAVAAATLFLPLALAGSALPSTAHWARRLGETLVALVLSKLAIVAVLTLAVDTVLGGRGGLSALVQGMALFGLSAVAPMALARMLPMIEAGATAHLDGMGRNLAHQPASAAERPMAWIQSRRGGNGKGDDDAKEVGRVPGVEADGANIRPPVAQDPMDSPAPAGPPGTVVGGGPPAQPPPAAQQPGGAQPPTAAPPTAAPPTAAPPGSSPSPPTALPPTGAESSGSGDG